MTSLYPIIGKSEISYYLYNRSPTEKKISSGDELSSGSGRSIITRELISNKIFVVNNTFYL